MRAGNQECETREKKRASTSINRTNSERTFWARSVWDKGRKVRVKNVSVHKDKIVELVH